VSPSAQVDSPTYAATYFDPRGSRDLYFSLPAVPYLKLAAVHDEQAATLTLFALNRSVDDEISLRLSAAGFSELEIDRAVQMHDADLDAVNSRAGPDRVKPSTLFDAKAQGSLVSATLLPASWNVIRVKEAARR
jgi:alpha-N-arabinofuranosidase